MRAVLWHSCLRKASWKGGVVTGIYRPPGIAVDRSSCRNRCDTLCTAFVTTIGISIPHPIPKGLHRQERKKGVRCVLFGVHAPCGRSDNIRRWLGGNDRIIPLEKLPTGAVVRHMRALLRIVTVVKCLRACWTVHACLSSTHSRKLCENIVPFISHHLSKFSKV